MIPMKTFDQQLAEAKAPFDAENELQKAKESVYDLIDKRCQELKSRSYTWPIWFTSEVAFGWQVITYKINSNPKNKNEAGAIQGAGAAVLTTLILGCMGQHIYTKYVKPRIANLSSEELTTEECD